jgi:LuxR family transcriptional regulator, maltose regulon positive regulatory protein
MAVEPDSRSSSLLLTKLRPPVVAPGVIERPRLIDALSTAARHRLTMVRAPLGYGKTTLLTDWWQRIHRSGPVVAWLSLDEPENDSGLFWRYVVGALREAGSPVGAAAEIRLCAPGADPRGAVIGLLNELALQPTRTILVLDDYHAIREPECHDLMALFLDRAPTNVHVVIATRSDPPLPLGAIRGSGRLAELQEPELRLTAGEAAEFVRSSGELSLTDDEMAVLVARTEGWAAALRLAVVWLTGEADRAEALRNFAGDNRHLADYLTEHLLSALDPRIERFLLRTSVLARMCAPLCEAVTGERSAADLLATIERANLLLIPLDGRRQWYRYHHLFAGLLQAELTRREPQLARTLHRRACAWHRRHGTAREAFEHAMGAGDHLVAAEVVTGCWTRMVGTGRSETLRRWLERFPPAALVARPELGYIGAAATGRSGGAEGDVDRWLRIADAAVANGSHPAGRAPSSAINGDLVRAQFVYRDVPEAAAAAQRAADLGHAGRSWRVPAFSTLAFLRYLCGDPTSARAAVAEALRDGDAPLRPNSTIQALATRALLDLDSDGPEKAGRSARRALEAAWATGVGESATGGLAHTALGRALAMGGRVSEGLEELRAGEECLRDRAPIAAHVYALLSLADGYLIGGDFVAAQRTADDAEGLLELFTDAGIMPALLAELRRRSQLQRRRRRAGPTTDISQAELAVLRLMAERKSRAGIAGELLISLNTVKTHTASIYRKLGVGSRTEAVVIAHERQLL